MDFKAANLTFNATTIKALVISNGFATLTGTGTINGSGNYGFLVTGVDGGDIRIQITDPSNNNIVIYDTQPGAAATATPSTSVTGNVVVQFTRAILPGRIWIMMIRESSCASSG